MNVVCLAKPGEIVLQERSEPTLGPEDVLIELRFVGLCGSDLSAYRGQSPMVTYPRIPGHEVAGVIAARGKDVPGRLALGARCTVSPYSHCGNCPACALGRFNTCERNQTLGVQRDGAMLERLAIHHSKVFVSDKLSLEELAIVEPLSVGFHAARRGRVAKGDTVLVLGCGAIGLGAIAACARHGARVVAADVDGNKLAQARSYGASETVDATRQDPAALCRELTNGRGVDLAIEAAGAAGGWKSALEAACFAGRMVCIGYAKADIAVATRLIVQKELDVLGSRNALDEFPAVMAMLEARELPYTGMISKTLPLASAAEAFSIWDQAPEKYSKILLKVGA